MTQLFKSAFFRPVLWGVMLAVAMGVSAPGFASDPPFSSQGKVLDWPETIADLAQARTTAVGCVRRLKVFENRSQIMQGGDAYSEAKSDFDGIIAGLRVALYETKGVDSLPDLRSRLRKGYDSLARLCKASDAVVPHESGERGSTLEALLHGPIEPLIKAVSAGIAALYDDHRQRKANERHVIEMQLKAAEWPSFDAIEVRRRS
jgi:hypothetical protein